MRSQNAGFFGSRVLRSFFRPTFLVALLLLVSGRDSIRAQAAAGGSAGEARLQAFHAGMPLTDALLELQARGLRLVFSSRVVGGDMRVQRAPGSRELRAMLEELLAPHGLTVEEESGGSLVIVPRKGPPPPASVQGAVVSRHALIPLPGVSITLLERATEVVTGPDGRFRIDGVAAGAYTVQARRAGFVVERESVALPAGASVDMSFVLQPAPLTGEEVVVHPSRIAVLQEQPVAPFSLDRDEILRLPHVGDDVFRTLSLMPGTASNDVTAQFHVRGGRRDEVLVLLDGQELYDAYHLKDFDNALSVVAASGLASLDLTTGAFPSNYGDRMGGILDLTTLTPPEQKRFRLSVSLSDAQIESSGTLGERTAWLASARRGATDVVGKAFGQEDPVFWDLFAKVDYRLGAKQALRLNALYSADRLGFTERDGEELTRLDTEYDSSYAWLTHQAVFSNRLYVDTAVSSSRIGRDRRGIEDEDDREFAVRDERDLIVTGLLQSWNFQAGDRNFVKAGFELRRFESDYDYASFREFEGPVFPQRPEPQEGAFAFRDRLTDDYLGLFVSDRFRAAPALTLEIGARFDRHSWTGDNLWSPRANLAWGLGRASVLRLGWGHYHQSQRVYELQVTDADTRVHRAERSEHWVAGFEHLFDAAKGGPLLAVRAEVYWRDIENPRLRYESLVEPYESFPEGEVIRFRVEPESGTANGVEVFLQGRAGKRLDWWANYTYALTEERIDGRDVPRAIDQRHTVNVDVNYKLGREWALNLAWRYHTGWPTTPISIEERDDGEGDLEATYVMGDLNSARLPGYHRLDARISRKWPLGGGWLIAFLDAQNVYNRRNVAGFHVEQDPDTGAIITKREVWPGFFASFGVSWEF